MRSLGSNYWKLFTAQTISNLGDGVSMVAYPWLMSAVTRDPFQIALVGVATRLPWLFFSLPAGVITDRADRRTLIAWMNTFQFAITLAVAAVVWAGRNDLADPAALAAGTASAPDNTWFYLVVLYGSALLFGMAEVVRDNASQTLMPSLVDHSRLEQANGTLWGAESVMNSFVGPPVGGLLLAIGFAFPFFVDAASFAVAGALIFLISGTFRSDSVPTERVSWRAEIGEGVRWLWHHRFLRSLAIILGVQNAMFALALATYVLFVQEILELDAARFGVLLTAGAAGGVIGSFLAARLADAIGRAPALYLTLLGSMVGLAITGLTSSWTIVWVMSAMTSFLAVLWNVITVSLRQTIIPDHLLGRVNSVYRFFAWGMMPLGTLLAGIMVAIAEAPLGRLNAIRLPFLFAAGVYAVLFVFAVPRLSTREIDAAQAGAVDQEAG